MFDGRERVSRFGGLEKFSHFLLLRLWIFPHLAILKSAAVMNFPPVCQRFINYCLSGPRLKRDRQRIWRVVLARTTAICYHSPKSSVVSSTMIETRKVQHLVSFTARCCCCSLFCQMPVHPFNRTQYGTRLAPMVSSCGTDRGICRLHVFYRRFPSSIVGQEVP